jgi:hypothetical protein
MEINYIIDRGFERYGLWLLKNSHSRSSQKFRRSRMPYKRRSRFWWTFSMPSPGPFSQKRGFFNSHACFQQLLPRSPSFAQTGTESAATPQE